MKIVFIGSGSIIFVKNLIGDCLLTPCLADAEYALLDIDAEKLALSERMLQRLNESVNSGRRTSELIPAKRRRCAVQTL